LRRVLEQSPFRALKTRLRFAFEDYEGPDVLIDVLLGWGSADYCSIPVVHRERRAGRTTYTPAKLLDMGILVLTGYSTAPLRFASWVGFGLTAFGVAVLTYVVILAVFFGSVPGFPFLASLISIFSGAQLFALGLFGEYLTRLFNHALGRPTYVVKEAAGNGPGGPSDD
jgi:undecaprenyl-phosphate 4-deoxy-4-formamido-L-arabinose transferase